MESSPISELPPELRQHVYDLVLPPEEGILIDFSGDTVTTNHPFALTQSCRKIRSECRKQQDL